MADEHERKKGRPLGSELLGLLLPVDPYVLAEARRLSALKGVRVEDLVTCIAQDPVVVIEFLKAANAICLSEGKPVLSSLLRAIDRLGSQSILKLLEQLAERSSFAYEEVNYWFEIHRSRCKRTSIISRLWAETLIKHLSDDCQLSGLFSFFGDLLAVSHLQEQYVSITEENQKGVINYRIFHSFKFEPQQIGLTYLRKVGIPDSIIAVIDKASPVKADRAIMKTLIAVAGEMVAAFDSNKWEKLSPGVQLPAKSSIRLLVINKSQYLKLYERATEYLTEMRNFEERKRTTRAEVLPDEKSREEISINFVPQEQSLQNDIQNLLFDLMTDDLPEEPVEAIPSMEELESEFSLEMSDIPKSARSNEEFKKVDPPKLQTSRANQFLESICHMFESASSSEELLTDLLERLTDDGRFEKAAIIALSNDKSSAIVVAARGLNLKHGSRMRIEDPLSPLAQGFSKIQSFGSVSNESSPFGSKAFALAPLNANHHNPIAIYADCGNDGSLTFEARRVFRTVVEMANERLMQLPGGIPLELEENY